MRINSSNKHNNNKNTTTTTTNNNNNNSSSSSSSNNNKTLRHYVTKHFCFIWKCVCCWENHTLRIANIHQKNIWIFLEIFYIYHHIINIKNHKCLPYKQDSAMIVNALLNESIPQAILQNICFWSLLKISICSKILDKDRLESLVCSYGILFLLENHIRFYGILRKLSWKFWCVLVHFGSPGKFDVF